MKKLLLLVTLLLVTTQMFGQNREFPLRQTLTAPLPVITAHPEDGHMRDYLVISNQDETKIRLAVLSKWRIEFHPNIEDPSIWVVSILDTTATAEPMYDMAEPLSDKDEPLNPQKNFCVTCELVLRALWNTSDLGERPAGLEFRTNVVDAEMQLESDPYIWPDGKKADLTIQVFERSL